MHKIDNTRDYINKRSKFIVEGKDIDGFGFKWC